MSFVLQIAVLSTTLIALSWSLLVHGGSGGEG